MKKRLHYIILILFLTVFVFNSCRKTIFNYRHKYKGNWELTTIHNFWCAEPSLCTTDTTYRTVKITYGDKKDEIKIGEASYRIDNLGKIFDINQDKYLGEFSDQNTVSFSSTYASPGSQNSYIAKGHKK